MKSNIPWSVKGIDPEAREAAKIAARRAGMTLGEWLNSLILQSGELPEGLAAQLAAEAAAEEVEHVNVEHVNAHNETIDEDSDDVNDLQSRLENLNRRLDASERQSALAVSGIDQSIERLASTIESSRRLLTAGDVAPKSSLNELQQRVDQLHRQIELISAQGRTGLDSRTLIALEKAIAGVASHIEKSDRRNAELVQSVEEAISELSSKVGHAESQASEAISRIDLTLDRVSSRIDSTESEQRRGSARLNERLAQLDERLATTHVQREAGIGGVERRLAGLETRLETVQGQLKAQLDEVRARPVMPAEAISRKEFDDWSRRQIADAGSSQATARQSLANLEARIAVLSERADRLQREGSTQATAAVERVAENARASSERADAAVKRILDSSETLKSEVSEIGNRLERSNHTATETMSALGEALQFLTRRLDGIESNAQRTPAPAPAIEVAPAPVMTPAREPEPEPAKPARVSAPAAERKVPSKSPGWLWRDEPAAEASTSTSFSTPQEDAAAGAYHGSEEVVEVFGEEPAAETPGFDEEPAHADGTDDRGFDLSNIMFNLDGARDRHPEETHAELEHTQEEDQVHTYEPVPEREPVRQEDNAWLEQARRAAKAAGPADTSYDFDQEKSGGPRKIIIIAIAVLLVIVLGLVAINLAPRFLGKHSTPGRAQATNGQHAAISPAKPAPNENGLAPRGDQTPATAPVTTPAPLTPAPVAEAPAPTPAPPAPAPAGAKPSAEDSMKAAAEGGNAHAEYSYAMALKAKSSPDLAVDYMKRAAGKGLAAADRQLGIWYEQGDGIAKDVNEAAKHYLAAAQHGDIQAMHNLGFFYAQGMGDLKKDGPTAERWFKGAAERGLVASQVNLAIIYSQAGSFDLAAKTDPNEYANLAYFWAAVAAAHGDQQAERLRAQLANNVKPDAKADLDKKVAAFKMQPFDAETNGGFDTNPEAFLPTDQQQPLDKDGIISIQQMLNELGFKAGAADGRLGPSLETAIKQFQTAYHLPPTGVADHNLLAALDIVPKSN